MNVMSQKDVFILVLNAFLFFFFLFLLSFYKFSFFYATSHFKGSNTIR